MRRRRLMLVTAAAVVALLPAWYLLPDRLSPEERRLVGTWYAVGTWSGEPETVEFAPDRRVRWWVGEQDARDAVRWSVSGQDLMIDPELNPVRRALRPLAPQVRIQVRPVESYRLANPA